MPPREGDPLHQGLQRLPDRYQEEGVPCSQARLQRLPHKGAVPWQERTGEEVQRHLLPRRIRTEHRTGERSTGQVHEGQAPEHRGARLRHPDPVHGPEEDKYDRARTGEQGDAPIGHRLQPEEVPEIRPKTDKKWGGETCFGGIGEKYPSIAILALPEVSKIQLLLLT